MLNFFRKIASAATSPDKYKMCATYIRQYGLRFIVDTIKNRKVPEYVNYNKWLEQNEPTNNELDEQHSKKFEYSPKISIVVDTHNAPIFYLSQMINSVRNQTYSN